MKAVRFPAEEKDLFTVVYCSTSSEQERSVRFPAHQQDLVTFIPVKKYDSSGDGQEQLDEQVCRRNTWYAKRDYEFFRKTCHYIIKKARSSESVKFLDDAFPLNREDHPSAKEKQHEVAKCDFLPNCNNRSFPQGFWVTYCGVGRGLEKWISEKHGSIRAKEKRRHSAAVLLAQDKFRPYRKNFPNYVDHEISRTSQRYSSPFVQWARQVGESDAVVANAIASRANPTDVIAAPEPSPIRKPPMTLTFKDADSLSADHRMLPAHGFKKLDSKGAVAA